MPSLDLQVPSRRRRRGDATLTPRQVEVAALVREGLSNAQIETRLGLRPRGVHTTLTKVALLGSGSNYVDPGSWIEMTIGYASPHNYYNDSVGGFPDCALRVHGRGGNLRFWVYQDEAQFIWSIDGVKQGFFTVPAGNRFGWYTIATGLDEGADHVYEVQTGGDTQTAFQVAYVDAVMFSGAAPAYGSALAAREGLGAIGNSITAAVTGPTDSSLGWFNILARRLGRTPYNRGKGGNAVEDMMVRTAGITDISPELPECIVLAGTNNLTAAGNGSTPGGTFGANYQTLLTNLLTGTAATIFYVVGILPRNGYSAATLLAWNGSGNGVQGSIAAVQAANPADAARLIYVDPVPFALNVGGADYTTNYADGLHLNDAGNVVLANGLEALFAPSDTTPPTVVFATINAAGTILTVGFDEPTAGVDPAEYATSPSRLQGTLHMGSTDTDWRMNISQVYAGESYTLAYAGSGTRDLEGNLLAAFSGFPITNNSTQSDPAHPPSSDALGNYGLALGLARSYPILGVR